MPLIVPAILRCFPKPSDLEISRRERKRSEKKQRRDAKKAAKHNPNPELAKEASEDAFVQEAMAQQREDDVTLAAVKRLSAEGMERIRQVGGAWFREMLVFDFETGTSALEGQPLRVGYYQLRGMRYDIDPEGRGQDNTVVGHALRGDLTRRMLDEVREHGFIYDKTACKGDEPETVKKFVARYNRLIAKTKTPRLKLKLLERSEFVKFVLYNKPYSSWKQRVRDQRLWIGHNIHFDVGALARHTGLARGGFMHGGLSNRLCDCPTDATTCIRHANVCWKKLGPKKYAYKISCVACEDKETSTEEDEETLIERSLHILDTLTLAKAIYGAESPGGLGALCERHKTKHRKLEGTHNEAITFKYLRYCMRDVLCTFELFQKLRTTYEKKGLSCPITAIYSPASVGKAYLREFGVIPFLKTPNIDEKTVGIFMETYLGARSEVHVRHKIVEVQYLDFKSQYSLANGLLKNQDLLLAESLGVISDNPETIRFLNEINAADLFERDTWPKLKGVALVDPAGCVLPTHTAFRAGDPATLNVALCKIIKGPKMWISFQDLIVSFLKTGNRPEILHTRELTPIGRQQTKKFRLIADDPLSEIDLDRQDFFIEVINQRTRVKKLEAAATDPIEKARLHDEQIGAKVLASASAYGALVEFNVDERVKEASIDIFFGGDHARKMARGRVVDDEGEWVVSDVKVETPGPYFAPYGAGITASGRLLLAMAEHLFEGIGITYAHMDTDAISPIRPEGMSRKVFHERVRDVQGAFQSLNLFEGDAPILELEDVNFRLRSDGKPGVTKMLRPLYFLGTSPKRYGLANRRDGDWVMRKGMAHGASHIFQPPGYDHSLIDPAHRPHPAAPVGRDGRRDHGALIHGSAPELMIDLWREAFRLFDGLGPSDAPYRLQGFIRNHPQLQNPQSSQLSLTTAHAWKTYAMGERQKEEEEEEESGHSGPDGLEGGAGKRPARRREEPIPNARAGMFIQTLPEPTYYSPMTAMEAKLDDRTRFNKSLYADGGLNLTMNLEDYRVAASPDDAPIYTGLYWRGTNEFPLELFQPPEISEEDYIECGTREIQPHLKSVGEALCNYFSKPNWKTGDPQGVGGLPMCELVIMGRIYAGKQTNPLAHLSEGDADEDLERFDQQHLSGMILHAPVLDGIDPAGLSKVSGIELARLHRIIRGAQSTTAEVRAIGSALKSDAEGNITLQPRPHSNRFDRISLEVCKACLAYEELASLLDCEIETLKQIADRTHTGFRIVKGCVKVSGAAPIPIDALRNAIRIVTRTNMGAQKREALKAKTRERVRAARAKTKIAEGYVEIKTMRGGIRLVRPEDAVKYELEWEARRKEKREYAAERRETRRLRSDGKMWYGKSKGLMLAELDSSYLSSLMRGDPAPEIAAEFTRRRQLDAEYFEYLLSA